MDNVACQTFVSRSPKAEIEADIIIVRHIARATLVIVVVVWVVAVRRHRRRHRRRRRRQGRCRHGHRRRRRRRRPWTQGWGEVIN
jgi:hypothetical protein